MVVIYSSVCRGERSSSGIHVGQLLHKWSTYYLLLKRETPETQTPARSRNAYNPPFEANDSRLHSIDTGVIASCSVNADKGRQVGKKIVDGLVGQKVQEYVFKKKDQAVILEAKDAVQTGTETGLVILCFCSGVSFQQGHLRESCWTKFSLMNFAAIHLHFLKRQMFYVPQTKLHSPMPCGNKFQICLAHQHQNSVA